MNTATTTTTGPTTARRIRRHSLPLLAATLVSALVLAVPAAAQPAADLDEVVGPPPQPAPEIVVQGAGQCDPDGFSYLATVVLPLDDRPLTVKVDWSEVDGPAGGTENAASGFVPADEGSYELVATVHYPQVHTEDQILAAVSATSAPTVVTVSCEDDPEDPDPKDPDPKDPTGNPGGGSSVGSDIVQASPNFTG
jgi:hypothetical protein